jgi:hypothetical protein
MIKKVFHSVLAILMVMTVTGLTINMHYCQEHLYDLALFSPAHSCCEAGGHCHMPDPGNTGGMDHCEDTSIHVDSTGEYVASFPDFSFEAQFAIELFVIEMEPVDQISAGAAFTLKTFWYQEPPPPHEVDLTSIQTFLI